VLPVTVFVTLDAVGDGFGVGLGVGFADDFVAVGGAVVALGAAALETGPLEPAEPARAELAAAEFGAAELAGGPDETGSDEPPAVGPDNASGRGALLGASLKLRRTTRPATVATNTATKRRMVHPPSMTRLT